MNEVSESIALQFFKELEGLRRNSPIHNKGEENGLRVILILRR
jgi:hypothetical protein